MKEALSWLLDLLLAVGAVLAIYLINRRREPLRPRPDPPIKYALALDCGGCATFSVFCPEKYSGSAYLFCPYCGSKLVRRDGSA